MVCVVHCNKSVYVMWFNVVIIKLPRNVKIATVCYLLASSRRSVSQGAAQKTVREKIKKCGESKLPLAALFFIFRALFSALRPD